MKHHWVIFNGDDLKAVSPKLFDLLKGEEVERFDTRDKDEIHFRVSEKLAEEFKELGFEVRVVDEGT